MSRIPDDVSLARPTDDSFPAYVRFVEGVFGEVPDDATIAALRAAVELDRFVSAERDGTLVGTAGSFGFELSLPGGVSAGCAGVTAVAVRQDHRRRGLLRRMLGAVLGDARDRGEPFAALWASEATIYGRFGFGPAVPTTLLTIDRPHAALRHDLHLGGPVPDVEMVDLTIAADRLAPIHDAVRAQRPGMFSRSAATWPLYTTHDPPGQRDGAGPRQVAIVPGRGYALYRIKPGWVDGAADGTVVVEELLAVDVPSLVALWTFVASTDLAARVIARTRPVDDPIVPMLVDGARARRNTAEPLWLCLLDLPAALSARRYGDAGRLVVEVADASLVEQAGRYSLDVDEGVAQVSRTDDEADLELDAAALATVFLGGVRPATLASAGRIAVRRPSAVGLADRMFAATPMPWVVGEF